MAKAKRIDTGEIVNIVSWGATGSYTDYYDSKGEFHHTDLNRYNHFEDIIENGYSTVSLTCGQEIVLNTTIGCHKIDMVPMVYNFLKVQ